MNSNNTQSIIDTGEHYFLHTYNRFPVVFERGEGVYLYDKDGKEYLDFFAGIAVNGLGYGHPEYKKALHEQIDKLVHISNYYYSEPAAYAAKGICEASGMDKVFFTNSGAEAIEGALKMARKYGKGRTGIIAMEHSFHGRTMGAVSVTGTASYREPFGPMITDVSFATFNDLESVRSLVNDDTCAIILETIQGEGGINVADADFITGIRKICDDNDIVMIIDEVQCGMGRSGKMFAFMNYGIEPDILTVAKGIGNGVPVGAFLCKEKFAALVAGDHGSTYGGNPLVTAAIDAVLKIYKEENILDNVNAMGDYLYGKLEELKEKYPFIIEHRGVGLIQGLVFDRPVKDILLKALDKGLVLISAGSNIIRFIPPFIIKKEDIDKMVEILDEILK